MGGGQPGIACNGPLRRKGFACHGKLIKNVAGVGRIDDQKADSQLLLFRQFVRMQAPEITQCEITRAGHGGVGTAVAAGPQEQCPAKGPAIFCAEQGGRIHTAVIVNGGEMGRLSSR